MQPKSRVPAQVPRKGSGNRSSDPGGSREGLEQHPPEVLAVGGLCWRVVLEGRGKDSEWLGWWLEERWTA